LPGENCAVNIVAKNTVATEIKVSTSVTGDDFTYKLFICMCVDNE